MFYFKFGSHARQHWNIQTSKKYLLVLKSLFVLHIRKHSYITVQKYVVKVYKLLFVSLYNMNIRLTKQYGSLSTTNLLSRKLLLIVLYQKLNYHDEKTFAVNFHQENRFVDKRSIGCRIRTYVKTLLLNKLEKLAT